MPQNLDLDLSLALLDRTPVESSNLKSVAYDVDTKTLVVEFQNGAVWLYDDVRMEAYEGLMAAPSKGRFFFRAIKQKRAARKAPEIGTCPKCGWKGRVGVTCEDCGCDKYARESVDQGTP